MGPKLREERTAGGPVKTTQQSQLGLLRTINVALLGRCNLCSKVLNIH